MNVPSLFACCEPQIGSDQEHAPCDEFSRSWSIYECDATVVPDHSRRSGPARTGISTARPFSR